MAYEILKAHVKKMTSKLEIEEYFKDWKTKKGWKTKDKYTEPTYQELILIRKTTTIRFKFNTREDYETKIHISNN